MNRDQEVPHFIIVGAMKSGTTTLAYHLNNHPSIYLPHKEVHFFNHLSEFEKGLDYYKEKLKLGITEGASIVGEKTPTYSYLEEVPQRIKSMCPDSKLVWIFRDPVERTFSNYMHAKRAGVEPLSFSEALNLENERIKTERKFGYRCRSQYIDQVERYLEHFPIEQMFFMTLTDMKKPFDTSHVLNQVFDFLGTNAEGYSHHETIKNKTSFRVKRKPQGLVARVKSRLFSSDKPVAIDMEAEYKEEFDENKAELKAFFEPYNERLLALTGINLNE